MSEYEFENEEEEEEKETLADKASWIGIANSTDKKFFLIAFMERTRETATGGWNLYMTLCPLIRWFFLSFLQFFY